MNPLLFELQEIDNRIARIKRERSKLDDGETLRSERNTLQKAVDTEKDRLNHLNTDRTDKELQLSTTEEKLTKQQTRLMNAKSAHEVTSLQRDIAGLNHARGDLDEALLMLMDEI
jgi:predicted  nucleic acid-binding Zn-ribbon protein